MMKMNAINICCIVFVLLAILFLVLWLKQRKDCPCPDTSEKKEPELFRYRPGFFGR
jgi:hypothetical protein